MRQTSRAAVTVTTAATGELNWSHSGKPDYKAEAFNSTADARLRDGVKVASESGRRTDVGKGARFTSLEDGVTFSQSGERLGERGPAAYGSHSSARKAASAQPERSSRPRAKLRYSWMHRKPTGNS